MADDRNLVYEDTYKAYREAEEKYLNLLFNIERMPEEEELWVMKRERMLELMQLKELMEVSYANKEEETVELVAQVVTTFRPTLNSGVA